MVKMLIDTSIWLRLGGDPKDGALISTIKSLVESGALQLLVPGIVLEEFLKNRERVARDHAKRLTAQFRIVREVVTAVGGDEAKRVNDYLARVDNESDVRARLASQTLREIELLLRSSESIEATETIKARAFERALQQRAPFHRGKISANDALVIEMYAEEVGQAQDDELRFAFVTDNTKDFSAADENEKNPHPDYVCFTPGRSEYFVSLPEALRSVDSGRVDELLRNWELEQPTVADLIRRYMDEETALRHLSESVSASLNALAKSSLGEKIAAKLKTSDVVEYCKRRLQEVKPQTMFQTLGYLGTVLRVAEEQWGTLGVSRAIVDDARKQLEGKRGVVRSSVRNRRLGDQELQKVIEHLSVQDGHRKTKHRMAGVVEFALITGRLLNEIYSIKWKDFDRTKGKACIVYRNKSRRWPDGKKYELPLPEAAAQIILREPRQGERVFGAESGAALPQHSASQAFRSATKKAKIKNLRFQDLRREAVMRMLEKQVPIEEIEKITGLTLHRLEQYRDQYEANSNPSGLN